MARVRVRAWSHGWLVTAATYQGWFPSWQRAMGQAWRVAERDV
jgi:hypothetical protein